MNQKGSVVQDRRQENLLALLKEAQHKLGYVPKETMADLAESLGIPLNEVFGVASFYSFISTRPLGRNIIRICKSLPCYLKHNQTIIESVEKEIGIEPGETTPDGKFSLELANCIGLCDQAPAMMINDDAHGNLTPQKIKAILKAYK